MLSSTLQALKRDSMRPSISGRQPGTVSQQALADETGHSLQLLQGDGLTEDAAFSLADAAAEHGPGLADEAAHLFGEAAFVAAFEQVFAFQLQRTRHGATDKSRVVELAGACCSSCTRAESSS